jgi:ketosteroid isomerase-like protein
MLYARPRALWTRGPIRAMIKRTRARRKMFAFDYECSPNTRYAYGQLYMRRALLIAVLVLTVVPMAVAQKQSASGTHRTSVEEAIRKLDNERIQAQIHADATALDRIYAADFIGVGPSGRVRTKPQVILDFTSGDLKFQSITTDDVQVRVYGNTAVETGRSIMNGQDKGQTVPRDTRFTRVWVKQQGRWRLVANHYSSQTTRQ